MAATLAAMGNSPLAVTLVYNDHRPTLHRIQSDLYRLHMRVDASLLGRRYTRKPELRSCLWAVVEGFGSHPHLHAGWLFSSPDHVARFEAELPRLWAKFATAGSIMIKSGDEGWARYACKALITTDHVFLI